MWRPGANFGLSQCPQAGLDPDNGTELRTLETKLANEDKEGSGPTMDPDFWAAELPSQIQFQIFPVSMRVWIVGGCGVGWQGLLPGATYHIFFCLLLILSRMPSHYPTVVDKY